MRLLARLLPKITKLRMETVFKAIPECPEEAGREIPNGRDFTACPRAGYLIGCTATDPSGFGTTMTLIGLFSATTVRQRRRLRTCCTRYWLLGGPSATNEPLGAMTPTADLVSLTGQFVVVSRVEATRPFWI